MDVGAHTEGGSSGQPDEDLTELLATTGLGRLRWDNRFVDRLSLDPSEENRPRQVRQAMSSLVTPHRPSAPALVAWSAEVSDELGIDPTAWTDEPSRMAAVFSGAVVLPGARPHAAAYGGHQFGNWAGQLGDGRAMSLGEVVGPDGRHHTLQLKGAGPTPYSRGADGFAVLRSSVREFLCSEAMHHLGVATTRALSLTVTGDKVVRDILYDGNPRPEPGAVVCRVAPSFIRFGNFQLFAARQELDRLRELADFTIDHYFPEVAAAAPPGDPARYEALFAEVSRTTLAMAIDWMRVGFVHGVMNTDNMSIHGATIDYGPYGWLEGFDPGWTPNTTDAAHRRYRYGQQPQVAQWNLLQLANALVQLTEDPEPLQATLEAYGHDHDRLDRAMWRSKLGLDQVEDVEAADAVVGELFPLLVATETDMTIFFRALGGLATGESPDDGRTAAEPPVVPAALAAAYYDPDGATAVAGQTSAWLERRAALCRTDGRSDRDRQRSMDGVNPRYVLRNYLAQLAIDAAEQDDFEPVVELLDVLRDPYRDQSGRERYAEKRPEWARSRPGCSQLSCSS
ncbi:MAG: YdiU family protein [Actinomycetota bacterium]